MCPNRHESKNFAAEAGSSEAVNVVLIGILAKCFDISYDKWIEVIETTVAPKLTELNKEVF